MTIAVLLWQAARARPRLTLLALAGITASIAPVIWVPLNTGSSAGNRFLYAAGVWYAMLLAIGVRRLDARAAGSPVMSVVRTSAVTILTGIALISVVHQAHIWRRAAVLSRSTIEQVRSFAGHGGKIFISDLPSLFADGPYVINTLAFDYYFGNGDFPSVRARPMALKYDHGDVLFAFWADDAETRAAAADEQVVALRLPIWMPDAHPQALLETPPNGAHVVQPFKVRGWAVDANSRTGPGIDAVQVYAYPGYRLKGSAVFVGTTRYGASRPDVAGCFGGRQFTRSEFILEVTRLPPGPYTLAVIPHDVLAQTFVAPMVVTVTVR